jgi:tetratricopeptide (TPR) repeat protein
VRRIARRYSPNETSMWHARVAMVMRKLQQPNEAMKEIELAIEMDTEAWRLLMIKAKILASQEKWQEAIDVMSLSNQILEGDPARMEKNIRDYWDNRLYVAEWYHDLEQYDQALESYHSCLQHNPDNYNLLPPMLEIWLEKDDSSGAMRFIRELNEANVAKSGHPRLVHAVIALRGEASFHFGIFETARQNQELKLVQATYNQALSIATSKNRRGQVAWMQYFLGILFERYLSKRDDAMDIWERAIKDSAKAVKGTGLFNARNEVVRDLCNLYIEKVSQSGKDSPVAAKYFKKVKDIGSPDSSVLWQYDTASALGVLHRLLGEDEQAKKCFRSRVKAGFDLLTDNDPTVSATDRNIWEGYCRLEYFPRISPDMKRIC